MLFWLVAIPLGLLVLSLIAHWFDSDAAIAVLWTMFLLSVLICFLLAVELVSAEKKAALINAKFGTTYTVDDIMWAGDTIERVILGTGHRVDLSEVENDAD